MLQQTTVATVIPYFIRFIKKWPTFEELGKADLDEILHAWQGLGYYNRAHRLHECAKKVRTDYNGLLPSEHSTLLTLPGVGQYTASAISAIAFDKPLAVIDGNVERLLARLWCLQDSKPKLKTVVAEVLQKFPLDNRPGDLAQSMMDFANSVCKPARPKCSVCPLTHLCLAYANNLQNHLPRKFQKKKPTRKTIFFIFTDERSDYVLLEKREKKGLLPGMTGFFSTPWASSSDETVNSSLSEFPLEYQSKNIIFGEVQHTFTHFHLRGKLMHIRVKKRKKVERGIWVKMSDIETYALPTVMKKIAKAFNLM